MRWPRDTGGKALLDNNDLTRGIVQAQKAISSYYIIGYYTTNTALDGKFRKIKMTVEPQHRGASSTTARATTRARSSGKFNTADKERQLEDALMLGDPITELTIAMEVNYFQLNRAEYFVPVVVKIPGSELALAKKGGAEHTLIDFIGEIKDEYGGTTVQQHPRQRGHQADRRDGGGAGQAARSSTTPASRCCPGKYTIKLLARDDETGRIGTYQTKFVDSQPEQGRRSACRSARWC